MKITPFSDNIIFFDSEFSTLDPYQGEILSIGMVKLNGEELYIELEYNSLCSKWVQKNILPMLTAKKVSRNDACKIVREFIGDNKPYMVGYANQFDAIYFYKLFGLENGSDNNPFSRFVIDFSSMLFAVGMDPAQLSLSMNKRDAFVREFNINPEKYKKHNALDDAKILHEVYMKIIDAH